jgi:hypothetical protein
MKRTLLTLVLALFAISMMAADAHAAAKITVIFNDTPGEGYFDTTPAKRVGGNPGRTIGEQRRIAAQFAADVWGAALDSDVEIKIRSSFDPLFCTADSATLASAGAVQIFADFQNAEFANTWYPVALANKLAGADLAPGADFTNADDVSSRFNANIGNTGCFEGGGWYYGLDAKNPANLTDMVNTLIHEFAHGLGFASFVDETNGSEIRGMTDTYSRNLKDFSTGKSWEFMTNSERKASAINFRKVGWTGAAVTAAVPQVLALGVPALKVTSPTTATYDVGLADFGAALTAPGVSGSIALVNDGVGVTSDGCEAISTSLSGRIALIDRGTCNFTVKAANAQAAGAVAVIIVNNVAGTAPGLGGSDTSIRIPVVGLSLADGTAIKTQLATATVNATVGLDTTRRAGTIVEGGVSYALVYTPTPVDPGSSVSHYDTSMSPNQTMEPFDTGDAPNTVSPPADLSLPLLQDLGW